MPNNHELYPAGRSPSHEAVFGHINSLYSRGEVVIGRDFPTGPDSGDFAKRINPEIDPTNEGAIAPVSSDTARFAGKFAIRGH